MAKIPKVILLIETSRGYGRGLLRGIAKYSRLHGPWMFYSEPGGEERALPNLQDWGADGIIARVPDLKKAEKVIAANVPTVVKGIKDLIPGVANIKSNGLEIGEIAAEHLLDRGFKQFAYCGFDDMFWSRERREGFCKTVEQAGCKSYLYERPRSKIKRLWQKEQNLMAEWLKSLPKPVGLMACNDDHARRVVEACKIASLPVPDEVAIIGVDNDEMVCELSDPPLSSTALNTEKAGYEAAELLDKLMKGQKIENQTIIIRPTHIVTRQSTDILAIEDKEVARAVRFIRQRAKEMIQVNDVVNAAALSRRALERRFRSILGRSIHSEIKRRRLEQISRMLVETSMSISQIALALGYSGIEKMSRYFRQEKGVSPLTYRRQYGRK